MKSRYVISIVIGATIGMIIAYIIAGAVNATNLTSGAIVGGLIGLCFTALATLTAGRATSDGQTWYGQPGMG